MAHTVVAKNAIFGFCRRSSSTGRGRSSLSSICWAAPLSRRMDFQATDVRDMRGGALIIPTQDCALAAEDLLSTGRMDGQAAGRAARRAIDRATCRTTRQRPVERPHLGAIASLGTPTSHAGKSSLLLRPFRARWWARFDVHIGDKLGDN